MANRGVLFCDSEKSQGNKTIGAFLGEWLGKNNKIEKMPNGKNSMENSAGIIEERNMLQLQPQLPVRCRDNIF
jgi:hypothetical protein